MEEHKLIFSPQQFRLMKRNKEKDEENNNDKENIEEEKGQIQQLKSKQ